MPIPVPSSPQVVLRDSANCKSDSIPTQDSRKMVARICKLPDATIRLIAAGEVVTRPFNVIKEMLENSLDAGSTNIRITMEQVGAQSIEIIDNGHGIARADAPLLCNRHTTSKLQKAIDLACIGTFGFRGEALASISEVADLEVRSFNMTTDKMGWEAKYHGGKLVSEPVDKYLQHVGTQISVTNLFKMLSHRRGSIKSSFTEEKKAVVELVSRYAVLNCDRVTVSLREKNSLDLFTVLAPMERLACLGQLYGMEVESNAIQLKLDRTDTFKADADVIFSYKKLTSGHQIPTLILFVNKRLVDCHELKKEIDAISSEYLNPKLQSSFVYISLEVPPSDIDVNVHPAKAIVSLHYQAEIITFISKAIRDDLKKKLSSQTVAPSSQKKTISQIMGISTSSKIPLTPQTDPERLRLLAPGSVANQTPSRNSQSSHLGQQNSASKRPHDLIHNDSSQPTLKQFSSAKQTHQKRAHRTINGEPVRPWPGFEPADSYQESPKKLTLEPNNKTPRKKPEILIPRQSPGDASLKPQVVAPLRVRRDLRLRSLEELRQLVADEKAETGSQVIKNSIFIGIFDHDRALIQYKTKLFAINLKAFLKEQYYQFYLFDFGNFPPIQILPPGNKMKYMIEIYLEDIEQHEKGTYEKLKFKTAQTVIDELLKHVAMYEDYLGIKMTENEIISIPCLIPNEVPNLVYLGRFLVELANNVDYSSEKTCLHQIGRHLALLFAEPPCNLNNMEVHRSYHDLIESKLYVSIKNYLIIPEWLLTSENICQISDTKDLYKVFERC